MVTKNGGNRSRSWTGSAAIEWEYLTLLTDAEPVYASVVPVGDYVDLVVDVKFDKGATIDIPPIVGTNGDTVTSRPSVQQVIADGGDSDGCGIIYSSINARRAKVTVTKTEAGDSTITQITISGQSR